MEEEQVVAEGGLEPELVVAVGVAARDHVIAGLDNEKVATGVQVRGDFVAAAGFAAPNPAAVAGVLVQQRHR